MRLFVGIPLPSPVIDALETVQLSLRTPDDRLHWSSPETWHITLQFLGECSPETSECVTERLAVIRLPRVPVLVRGTGVFERAGVFWAGVEVSTELRALEKRVVAATAQCGFTAEDRPYQPHVTLARAKGADRVSALRKLQRRARHDLEFPPFIATEFLLYESFFQPGGTRHEVRRRFPLA
jgi:RNA 2',3'-cyclic 3'-phosphodiesterase